MQPNTKITAVGIAGALATIVVFVLGQLDVDVTAEVAAALTTVFAFAAGYLIKEPQPEGVRMLRRDGGYSAIELLVIVILALLAVYLVIVLFG